MEGFRDGFKVVEFFGDGDGFVVLGVDGAESWIARGVADEEVQEL